MSQAVATDDVDPTDGNRGVGWLERNARQIHPEDHVGTDLHDKARVTRRNGDVDDLDTEDLYRVERPNGDPHLCLFVTHTNDPHAGACSCDGFRFNSRCRHLMALAIKDTTEDILRTDDDRAEELLEDDVVEPDPDVQEYPRRDDDGGVDPEDVQDLDAVEDERRDGADDAGDQEESSDAGDNQDDDRPDRDGAGDDHGDDPPGEDVEDVDVVETADHYPGPARKTQGTSGGNRPVDPSTSGNSPKLRDIPLDEDPLEVLPKWMKSSIQARGGDEDLNKRGCQVIASALGVNPSPEAVKRGYETDFEYAVYEATVEFDGEEYCATAQAHVNEDNVAPEDLDEMAETRAKKRAVKWASAGGLVAWILYEGRLE